MPVVTKKEITADFAVVGGGLAGLCAAVAAARNGIRSVLIQDRPVLGGNNSSEIRVTVGGAYGIPKPDGTVLEFREGGLLEELQLRNLYLNPGLRWTIWDHIMFQFAKAEPNLTLLLNTPVQSLEMDGSRIRSVTGWHMTEYCLTTVTAKFFADCSGDSILRLLGADCTNGREGRDVYGESLAPEHSDHKTMGSSALISCLPCQPEPHPFRAPGKTIPFTEDSLPKQLRADLSRDKYLFPAALETGGEQDTIKDADEIRDELYRLAYGYWEFVKNTPSQHGDRWELDWIGSLPGKRESFRYIGDHVLTQNDIESEGRFPDTVCHGGWPMDDHFPQGYRYRNGQTIMHHAPTPYGIPYRSLYSRNVENLFFAGRNASVSHMALSSTRVMGTCAVMGQAVGTAGALAVRYGTTPRGVYGNHIGELQSILQEQDQFLPFFKRLIPELSAKAALSHEILRDGVERTLADGDHGVWFAPGETCSYSFDSPVSLRSLRFIVDTDCTDNRRLRLGWETRSGYRKMPPMMPRDVSVEILRDGEWKCIHEWTDLHQRCITFALKEDSVSGIRLVWRRSWGGDRMHVFAFDVR